MRSSYRNQSIHVHCKPTDWFHFDSNIDHSGVNMIKIDFVIVVHTTVHEKWLICQIKILDTSIEKPCIELGDVWNENFRKEQYTSYLY